MAIELRWDNMKACLEPKAQAYGPGAGSDTIPQMIIGFGEDPYRLFKELFAEGLSDMGKSENQRDKKNIP